MVQETPSRVMGLLGTALISLFFLFSITFTNASFNNVEQAFPDPFAPENVTAFLDQTANDYSHFLAQNLFHPAEEDFGVIGEDLASAKAAFLDFAGLTSSDTLVYEAPETGEVAGAQTYNYASMGGFNVDTLFALLIK